ncbi:acyl-CoA N-acyltransferase [Dactylonectria estremocensis]|uniref:Acyl-CoA N-acyltransferase n=1 Tax=Dactylonectria estremocensis TaxID=1079267 RepID=A0A9P9F8R8_9HYPO|nr:acyl-CoA N-acyltransferase [Dactylonectria estremocensis]
MDVDGLSKTFQSQRLSYRALENNEADREFLHTQIKNDPVNAALSDPGWIQPKSRKHTEGLAEELTKATLAVIVYLPEATTTETAFGGTKTKTTPATPIGFVVLGWGGRRDDQVHHRSISIGISLAAPFQNKGYGAEAINWALDWAFRFGGFHRVTIDTVNYNERAKHLYQRLGFVEEGRSRQAHWFDRKWYDIIHFAMLEEEWISLRKVSSES